MTPQPTIPETPKHATRQYRPLIVAALIIGSILILSYLLTNSTLTLFKNDTKQPVLVSIDNGNEAFTVPPNGTHIVWLWLHGNYARSVATDVLYGDGYHFRQLRDYTFTGSTSTIPIEDAPPPTITLENLSMGSAQFFDNGVQIPAGNFPAPVDGRSRSLEARTFYEQGGTPYETYGTLNPEYGYVYRFLACGQTGTQGQNCGLFYDRVNDGGWNN